MNNIDWEKVYDKLSNGNPDARCVLAAWAAFVHGLDDAIDRDRRNDPEYTARVMLDWTFTVSNNPFWQANAAMLSALVVAAVNAYLDAERWKDTHDKKRQQYGDAYRSFWDEFMFFVAFLTGGWAHMRDCSAEFRDAAYTEQHPKYDNSTIPGGN
jgi:hypothetical protein